MPVAEAVLTVVREWIVKADNDLTAAAQILKLGKDTPTEAVGFHAQQCVEKYLKAATSRRCRGASHRTGHALEGE